MTAGSLVAICATLGAALATPALAAPEPAKCKLIRVDEWRVKPDRPTPTFDGFINGHPIRVLLDTGMGGKEGALLERAAAKRLRIPLQPYPGAEFGGVGGETKAEIGLIQEIRIGQASRRNWRVLVGGEEHGQEGVFILGSAYFGQLELELDLSRDAVRLFQSKDCRGLSLAYWSKEAIELPIWVEGGHITVGVSINGKAIRAVLDTGAYATVLDSAVAARLGVRADIPGTVAGACFRGFGKNAVQSWIGRFETFAIGNEAIRNPKIYFADLRKDMPLTRFAFFKAQKYEVPEMLLGADFLRVHRVLIARAYGKMFFTYEGGTVFPTVSAPC